MARRTVAGEIINWPALNADRLPLEADLPHVRGMTQPAALLDQDNNPQAADVPVLRRNLRVNEFCERAPMSRSLFWELVKSKQIPVVKFGSLTVIPHEAAERLLREGTGPVKKDPSGTPAD